MGEFCLFCRRERGRAFHKEGLIEGGAKSRKHSIHSEI